MTWIILAAIAATAAAVYGLILWLERGESRDDAWARSPERKRGVAAWLATREWAVGDEAWHHDARVTVTKVYRLERMALVKDGLGIEYPVMLSDLRHQRVRRAA